MDLQYWASRSSVLSRNSAENISHSAAEELRGFAHIQLAKMILIGGQQYPPWRMYLAAAAMARLSNIWNIK